MKEGKIVFKFRVQISDKIFKFYVISNLGKVWNNGQYEKYCEVVY